MKDRSNIYMIYAEYKRFHNLEWYADNMMYDSMLFIELILLIRYYFAQICNSQLMYCYISGFTLVLYYL